MTEAAARAALGAWGLADAELTLMAQRENIVFCARHGGTRHALRLHRPGYQSEEMIRSELVWMQHLREAGLPVPAPLPAQDGALLMRADGYLVDLLTWVEGRPLGATGTPLDLADRTGTFARIGEMMARMHLVSDAWTRPPGFVRQRWDLEGLLGDGALWGRFWDNPGLSASERVTLLRARARLSAVLECNATDFGLIHADMLRENVLLSDTGLGLIDFDDSGFGYRLFDVATALFKNRDEPDYPALEAAFLDGYRSLRPLDTTLLAEFTLIRALSYLGWIIPRMDEPGAEARQTRFLRAALPLAGDYVSAVPAPRNARCSASRSSSAV